MRQLANMLKLTKWHSCSLPTNAILNFFKLAHYRGLTAVSINTCYSMDPVVKPRGFGIGKLRMALTISLLAVLPHTALSVAPVVDDSENFTMLDEQQSDFDHPVARKHRKELYQDDDTERPLAQETPVTRNVPVSQATLLDKIQGLQQEVQELRGQLEVQSHELQKLKDQQLAFYKDLDARLPTTTAANHSATPTTSLSAPVPSMKQDKTAAAIIPAPALKNNLKTVATKSLHTNNPADEQISYLAAYELVKNKRFDQALPAMQSFTEQYPQGGYTANAFYWMGEIYMQQQDYPHAIDHFETVVQQFPSSNKSAASLLKIGYALAASGKPVEAKQRLLQVVRNYPNTNTAQLAAVKLKTLSI